MISAQAMATISAKTKSSGTEKMTRFCLKILAGGLSVDSASSCAASNRIKPITDATERSCAAVFAVTRVEIMFYAPRN